MPVVPLQFERFDGPEIRPRLDALAALRILVFRDWPYLYDGDFDYERRYLESYTRDGTVLIGAFEGSTMVGASTAMPLAHHSEDFGAAFAETPYALKDVFYCAESVLLPEARGQGAYAQFFEAREAAGRAGGFRFSAFCGVVRPENHPARPRSAPSLDPVWRHFGYKPLTGAVARFSWRDIGEHQETEKPLQFWIKPL